MRIIEVCGAKRWYGDSIPNNDIKKDHRCYDGSFYIVVNAERQRHGDEEYLKTGLLIVLLSERD
jgi:hypothetical protein